MTLLFAALLLAQAADPPAATAPAPAPALSPAPEPQPEIPAASSLHARKRLPPDLRNVEGHLIGAHSEVLADDVVDEMVDEFAADVARLGAAQVGPILIQRVRVSSNVNPAYAGVLESRLAAAVFRASSVALVRCVECASTRSRVEGGEWVVSRGITTLEEAQAIARKYGARTLLDVALSVRDRPSASMGMEVEMVRAQDSSIAFAEQYRMDAAQGMLYRGADRSQSREEKLKDLEERLNQRPRWSQSVEFGAMGIIGGDAQIWGGVGRFQLAEEFGDDREHQAGFSVGGFLNTSSLAGGMLSALWQTRIGPASAFATKMWLGLDAGVFLTGNAGSAPIGGGTFRWLVGERFAMHAALRYLAPLRIPSAPNLSYGGLAPELGVSFVWN
jgi:hypothetical protein